MCKQLINTDEIELKPSDVCKSRSGVIASLFAFSAVTSCFPQLLKCVTDMVVSYRVVAYLQCCYASHKHCNTDVLGVLLIYPHSPSGAARSWDRAYNISVNPLAAVL